MAGLSLPAIARSSLFVDMSDIVRGWKDTTERSAIISCDIIYNIYKSKSAEASSLLFFGAEPEPRSRRPQNNNIASYFPCLCVLCSCCVPASWVSFLPHFTWSFHVVFVVFTISLSFPSQSSLKHTSYACPFLLPQALRVCLLQ